MIIRTTRGGLQFPSIYSRYAVRSPHHTWQYGVIGKPSQQPRMAGTVAAPLLRQNNLRYYLVHAAAVSIILAGVLLRIMGLHAAQLEHVGLPVTAKPTASAQHVAASHPATAVAAKPSDRLTIPTLGVNAPVIEQGVAADGTIATPDNLWQVSLYSGEQLPGQIGNVIIVGHSGAPGQIGVFRNLPKIAIGSDITYKTVAGIQYVYRVVGKQSYGATDPAAKTDIYTPTGKPMLHLITCDGTWINSAYAYTQRMIVDAVLVQS